MTGVTGVPQDNLNKNEKISENRGGGGDRGAGVPQDNLNKRKKDLREQAGVAEVTGVVWMPRCF